MNVESISTALRARLSDLSAQLDVLLDLTWQVFVTTPEWPAAVAAGLLLVLVGIRLRRRATERNARRRIVPRARPVATARASADDHPSRSTAQRSLSRKSAFARAATKGASRRVKRVHALAVDGVPVIEIARSTGLALDAVRLALRLAPVAERQGSPQAARLAVTETSSGAQPRRYRLR